MYSRLLVPLDGSKRAEQILPHVEGMAMRYEATIVFFQVLEPPSMIPDSNVMHPVQYEKDYEQKVRTAEAYLSGITGEFQEKKMRARFRLGKGHVVEAIINAAESENADLIAIASHGRTGLSQVFYGSVAAGILHRIDRPLLLIRSN